MFRVEIESHCAGTAEPAIPAEPLQTGSDAGAEQWYKTIAKLMQGRNRNSTLTCEPRASALWAIWSWRAVLQTTSSYLVDPASSHMLVLKIKPCMSKYKHLYRETANGSLKQLWFI